MFNVHIFPQISPLANVEIWYSCIWSEWFLRFTTYRRDWHVGSISECRDPLMFQSSHYVANKFHNIRRSFSTSIIFNDFKCYEWCSGRNNDFCIRWLQRCNQGMIVKICHEVSWLSSTQTTTKLEIIILILLGLCFQ